jgi:hypothetical protein
LRDQDILIAQGADKLKPDLISTLTTLGK